MSAITPRQRALLHTIYKAEGTWDKANNRPIYDQTFGYTPFDTTKPHPDRVVRSGGYASAAAGAGQFMPDTWKMVHGGANPVMSPENQDKAALELVRRRGVDPDKDLDRNALNRLAPEWASLPKLDGNSYYGQPVRRADDLLSFYNQQLQAGGGSASTATSATPAPATASSGSGSGGGAATPALPATDGGLTALMPLLLNNNSSNDGSAALLSAIAQNSNDPVAAVSAGMQASTARSLDEIGSRINAGRRPLTSQPLPQSQAPRRAGQALSHLATLFA